MAEDQDPIADFLRMTPTTKQQRHDLWEAANQATSVEDFATRMKSIDAPAQVRFDFQKFVYQKTGASDTSTRRDSNIVGVDHRAIASTIADWASKLPTSLQKPAAMLAAFPADALASLAEMFSAPESVAAAGASAIAGRVPTVPPSNGYPGTPIAERINAAGRTLEQIPNAGPKTEAVAKVMQMVKPSMAEGYDRFLPNTSGYDAGVAAAEAPKPAQMPQEAMSAAPKLKLSAFDVIKAKGLMARGMSMEDALKNVLLSKSSSFANLPTDADVAAVVAGKNLR